MVQAGLARRRNADLGRWDQINAAAGQPAAWRIGFPRVQCGVAFLGRPGKEGQQVGIGEAGYGRVSE